MKSIFVLLALLTLTLHEQVNLSTQCPDQFVTNNNNICIRPNYIQGCQIYQNADQCATCLKEYELVKGKCSLLSEGQNPSILQGCLIEHEGKCLNCANGYRLIDDQCKLGVKFCEEYDSEEHCIKCNSEYSLIFNQCKHNQMLGCRLEQQDHTCLQCFKPFVLQNYQCVIPSCKTYNDYGCVACQCGFFMTDSRSCQKMQNGCLKYYRGTCVECLPHYKLKGGSCSIEGCLENVDGLCTSCKKDYQLIEGGCKFKNCLDWKDDTCQICDIGFNLVGGRCVQSGEKFVCSG